LRLQLSRICAAFGRLNARFSPEMEPLERTSFAIIPDDPAVSAQFTEISPQGRMRFPAKQR
jgi:hypothetical protein